MDLDLILNKTDKGRDELRSRALRLPMAARMLLVLADGSRTLGALVRQCPSGTNVPLLAQQLLELGLVDVGGAVPQLGAALPPPRRMHGEKYVFGVR